MQGAFRGASFAHESSGQRGLAQEAAAQAAEIFRALGEDWLVVRLRGLLPPASGGHVEA